MRSVSCSAAPSPDGWVLAFVFFRGSPGSRFEQTAILTSKLCHPQPPAWGEVPHVGKAAVFPPVARNIVPGLLGEKKQ